MGSGKHIGKVLLRIRHEETNIYSAPRPLSLAALPKFFCSDKKSYIICGLYNYITSQISNKYIR